VTPEISKVAPLATATLVELAILPEFDSASVPALIVVAPV